MTWFLRQDKITIILNIIEEIRDDGEASARVLKKICGKLIDIKDLIPGAKFHLAHLIIASSSVNERENLDEVLEVDDWCRADLHYFSLTLPAYSRRTKLQDPDKRPSPWSIKSYTDAAGGSTESMGRGVGMTIFPNMWTYVPWGKRINQGWTAYDGKSLAHKSPHGSCWDPF